MQAIMQNRYGEPTEVLSLEEVPAPVPEPGELLLEVHLACVTSAATAFQRGERLDTRLFAGLLRPSNPTPGMAVVGTVLVGNDHFAKGERVVAALMAGGAHAEQVVVKEGELVRRLPDDLDDAAGIAMLEAQTAWYFLTAVAEVQPGQEVLINGASGAVGSTAVQIAKHLGARVTGVCSTRNVELVRSLGADAVVDYTVTPIEDIAERFDLVLDAVGTTTFPAVRHLLRPEGRFLTTVLSLSTLFWSAFSRQCGIAFAGLNQDQDQLEALEQLVRSRELTVHVDRTVPLSGVPEAFAYVSTGRKRGLVLVQVREPERIRLVG